MITKVYAADLGQVFPFATQNSFGAFISSLITPAFDIAGILLLFYFLFAAFKYMTSGGDKEAINGARNMITHAIIGFALLILLILVLRVLPSLLGLTGIHVVI